MEVSPDLQPTYESKILNMLKADQITNTMTFKPSSSLLSEALYVPVPKLV